MANKSTQYFKLHQLLKASASCTKEMVAKELGVDIKSVPVYIHALKHKFRAEIVNVKDGRKVIAYKLVNSDKISVPKFRSNASSGLVRTAKTAKTVISDGSVAIPDKDLEIAKIDDRTMSDIHSSLGIDLPRTGSDY
jgi:ribosome-associated protein YbcJ (S4-like RNA binding protein)